MSNWKSGVFALLLALCALSAGAQSGTVKGSVVDAFSKEPLVGAYILYGEGKGVAADFDGNYVLDLPYGNYTLTASFIGYNDIVRNISVTGSILKVDFKLETFILNEVEIVADVARERETPVAFTNILPAQIESELGSQDLPMILNSTPGVYATQQGGGDGDARVTIRGFSQRNIAVMIDGIPVNDMENGWVFWSNWFGLDAVTRSIQVQRGLGASKIAIPSVGGTMNIITKGIDARKGIRVKQEVGNNGFMRTSLALTTGRMQSGWGLTVAGSFKQGNGWVDRTFTEGYFYYAKIEKQLGKHILGLSAMGAPQEHGQRSFTDHMATYDNDFARDNGVPDSVIAFYPERGLRYNLHWGSYETRNYFALEPGQSDHNYTPGEIITLNERKNFYHKPQFALRDFWSVNDKLYISNLAYLSVGNGGGTGFNSSSGVNILPNGQYDFQGVYDGNVLFEFGPGGLNLDEDGEIKSSTILRASYNNHFWYGWLSSATYKANEQWTFSAGLDARRYEGEHFREVYDLIGGDYFLDSDNMNQRADTKLREGDKMDYHDLGEVAWGGGFLQMEFADGLWSWFYNISMANSWYRATDYFRPKVIELADTTLEVSYTTPVEYNGVTYDRNNPDLKPFQSDWIDFLGYTVKTGANYNFSEKMNVFVNVGYLSKAPRFDNVFDRDNNLLSGYANEVVNGYELGVSFADDRVASNINAYYTKWNNRPVNSSIRVPHPNEPGEEATVFVRDMDALHLGIEWDAAYEASRTITFEGVVSVGDWTWQSEEEGQLIDDNGSVITDLESGVPFILSFDPKGVHVGDAAQLQLGASVNYEPIKNLFFRVRSTYFGRHFANFNPEDLVGNNAGRESWQTPGYNIVEFHTGYKRQFKGTQLAINASVFNVLDEIYISDARNNDSFNTLPLSNFDGSSASVFYGSLRRFNISLTATFN